METVAMDNGTQFPTVRLRTPTDAERRLAIFHRRGMFRDGDHNTKYQRATAAGDLEAAFSLVHDVFVEKNFILPRPSGMRIRIFETSSELAMFVGKVRGEIVGTIGLVVDSEDMGLPSDRVFESELDALRRTGKTVCEVTNFAILAPYRKGPMCTELMRCALAQAWTTRCNYMVCSVSPQQREFYEFIGFYQIGTERSYSDKVDDPVINMCWDLDRMRDLWQNVDSYGNPMDTFWKEYCVVSNPYIGRIDRWNAQAKVTFANKYDLLNLFTKCRDFFEECTKEQLAIVRKHLGASFDAIYSGACGASEGRFEADRFLPDSALRIARYGNLRNRTRFAPRYVLVPSIFRDSAVTRIKRGDPDVLHSAPVRK